MPSCRILLRQPARRARSLAVARVGNNMAASMAIMAITTSSSIRVKAVCVFKAFLPISIISSGATEYLVVAHLFNRFPTHRTIKQANIAALGAKDHRGLTEDIAQSA